MTFTHKHWITAISLLFFLMQGFSQLGFIDQSETLGVADTSRSYGIFWGDINNDGFPDFYRSNHYQENIELNPAYHLEPHIFINQSGNSFLKVYPELSDRKDFHSGGFFQFEDDTLTDLLIVTGGITGELLFENPDINFDQPITTCGPCDQLGRGRSLTFLDYNYDGRLDVIAHHAPPNASFPDLLETLVFDQTPNAEFNSTYNHILPDSQDGFIGDIDNDGEAELVTLGSSTFRVFDYDESGFELIYEDLTHYTDVRIEDFNNDGLFEALFSSHKRFEMIDQIDNQRIEAYIKDYPGARVFEFSADSDIELSVMTNDMNFNVFSGANNNPHDPVVPILLSANDTSFFGALTDTLSQFHLHVSYNSISDKWRFYSDGGIKDQMRISLRTTGTLVLLSDSGFTNINFVNLPLELKTFAISEGAIVESNSTSENIMRSTGTNEMSADQCCMTEHRNCLPASKQKSSRPNSNSFRYSNNALIESSSITIDFNNISGLATGDFDNDGDIDFISSNYNDLYKEPFTLYENDGSGNFILNASLTPQLAGATIGHTDAISTIDFNRDGNLDISAVNGWGGEYGTTQIFENTNNLNNWIAFELNGVLSNNQGIGSLISVHCGSLVQHKMMSGGFHRRAQDDALLHFGIGINSEIDSVVVKWPSGIITTLLNLPAGIIHSISETTPEDLDGDGILNADDNCPELFNPDQSLTTFYFDGDGDGYGNPLVTSSGCSPTSVFVENNLDCDDDNANINPGATEICDEIDNNCSGSVDEGFETMLYFADSDGDGYGDPDNIVLGCSIPPGYVANDLDCDDLDPNVNPDANEFCDGIDNNCNGVINDPGCDQCVPSNFASPPTGLFAVQTATTTQLKWNHYSDYQEGCLVSTQQIDSSGSNIGGPINFTITGLLKISADENGHNKTGAYVSNQEFIKFNQYTYPEGNTASWVPGALYKWRVKCACVIDNSIPKPQKVYANNLHVSPWSEWDFFTNLGSNPPFAYKNIEFSSRHISVYPNPTNGIVTIYSEDLITNKTVINVYDIYGKLVFNSVMNSSHDSREYELDLSSEQNGMYIVEFINDNSSTAVKLIKR